MASSLPAVFLACSLVVSASLAMSAGCSADGGQDETNLVPSGGDAGDAIDGLVSLALDPPKASLTLTPGGGAASKALVARGTFTDGSTRDVTALVAWTTESPANVAGGQFSTASPGRYKVSARAGSIAASAEITATLNGDLVESGFDPALKEKLAGSPTASAAPRVEYPLPGALFPENLAPVDVQLVRGNAAQSIARVQFVVDGVLDLRVYSACDPIDGAANGCSVLLSDTVCRLLAGASEAGVLTTTIRLASKDGSQLGETSLKDVAWTTSRLTGGLYFWSALNDGPTAIRRYDFDKPKVSPETYWTNADSPKLHDGTEKPCMGCHSVSSDGTKMALTFGGSDPSDFALIDIASHKPLAVRNTDSKGFATMTSFSPDGARLLNTMRGLLTLRASDATLADVGAMLEDTTKEAKSHPFWSPDGKSVAFVSWAPGENGASASRNGDLVRGAQIWIAPSDGKTVTGPGKVLVPRATGVSSFYPAVSDDGAFVVFNRSRCDGPGTTRGYGEDPCDGYDDPSAKVMVLPASGGTAIELANLDGTDTWSNSWPRWSPDHGLFRGKSIYWVAFSSRRPYGLRLAGSNKGESKPQLWFAAVVLEPGKAPTIDPSFAPVWLTGQNPDPKNATGNHVPQWARKAVDVIK